MFYLLAVWVSPASNVWVIGAKGTALVHDGVSWLNKAPGASADLQGVWGASQSDVHVVGSAGSLFWYDGKKWSGKKVAGFSSALNGVWGSGPSDVHAVGVAGAILDYDGASWKVVTSPTKKDLYAVWGTGPTNVYAVGASGTLLHKGGGAWTAVTSGTGEDLRAIWGSGPSDVTVSGAGGTLLRFDGKSWSKIPWTPQSGGGKRTLYGVWGSGALAHAVGQNGALLRRDASGWKELSRQLTGANLRTMGGNSPTNVYACGVEGLLRYDGKAWQTTNVGASYNIEALWISAKGEVFAVGPAGLALRFHAGAWTSIKGTTKNFATVWGTSASDVHAGGGKNLHPFLTHYNGNATNTWKGLPSSGGLSNGAVNGIFGFGTNDVYRISPNDTARYDGISWKKVTNCMSKGGQSIWGASTSNIFIQNWWTTSLLYFDGKTCKTVSTVGFLFGLWGSDANNVYGVGKGGRIVRCVNKVCKSMSSPTTRTLLDVWVGKKGEAFAVGNGGTILHRP